VIELGATPRTRPSGGGADVRSRNPVAPDGLDVRSEPLMEKVTKQSREQANQSMADRGSMREILGTETIREAILN